MVAFPYLDFLQMINTMAVYYTSSSKDAFRCMFESAYEMIPDNDLIKPIMYESILKNPLSDDYLKNSFTLLQWCYLINLHINKYISGTYISFDKFKQKYNKDNLVMSDWSHPSWKMIHYYPSKYDLTTNYALAYKAYISCLQFLLPCEKCKGHLKANLADHPIDQFFSSASDLFTWSYILHQTVSSQTGKKGISLDIAKKMYGVS